MIVLWYPSLLYLIRFETKRLHYKDEWNDFHLECHLKKVSHLVILISICQFKFTFIKTVFARTDPYG